jgi:hypothetical protein
MHCRGGLGTPNVLEIMQFGLRMQKLWALQGLNLIEKKKNQDLSNIKPTYVQTLHIYQ